MYSTSYTTRELTTSSMYWPYSDEYSDESPASEYTENSDDESFCSEVYFYFSQTREELKRKLEQERLLRQKQEEEAKMERERQVRVKQGQLKWGWGTVL